MKAKTYLHSDKETMWLLGEEIGLKGDALTKFCYTLYEVEVELEVDPKTGEAEIVSFKEI